MTAKSQGPKTPLEIVAYEEDVDLRDISWNQRFLEKVRDEYGLKHGQAVLYRNVAKDRWRMVACFYGLAVLVLTPVNKEERISLDLIISRFLRKFAQGYREAIELLDSEIEGANARVERRKKLASSAAKKRRKN